MSKLSNQTAIYSWTVDVEVPECNTNYGRLFGTRDGESMTALFTGFIKTNPAVELFFEIESELVRRGET